MIENLRGIQETVNFKPNTNIRLYINEDVEEYPAHWHAPLEIIMPLENTYQVSCCKTIYSTRGRSTINQSRHRALYECEYREAIDFSG